MTEMVTTYEDALKAYELRRKGKSLTHILQETNFPDGATAMMAIQSIEQETALLARRDRDSAVEMSLSRLDDAVAACYEVLDFEYHVDYDEETGEVHMPDFKIKLDAARTLGTLVKAQADILGLTKVDPTEKSDVVVLIQGEKDTYVRQLKEIVEAPAD